MSTLIVIILKVSCFKMKIVQFYHNNVTILGVNVFLHTAQIIDYISCFKKNMMGKRNVIFFLIIIKTRVLFYLYIVFFIIIFHV